MLGICPLCYIVFFLTLTLSGLFLYFLDGGDSPDFSNIPLLMDKSNDVKTFEPVFQPWAGELEVPGELEPLEFVTTT